MENNISSAEQLKTIRKFMEESSKFLSLSGLSGIFAGSFAIIGAAVAWFLILDKGSVSYDDNFRSISDSGSAALQIRLIADALAVLALSIASSLYFSARRAKKAGKSLWTPVSKRLLINMLIPLAAGGLFMLILLIQNHIQLIVPGLLIFYGLALVSAGKFTYGEVFYLGLLEIITGLLSALFPAQALWFWIFGFGFLHIAYGIFMFRKYEA